MTSQPIGGARCLLQVAGEEYTVFSAADGRFEFIDPADGPASLFVNGLVATSRGGESIEPGSYPSLHFELLLVPNADNQLPAPVTLPGLNPANARIYDGSEDVVLTVAGMEGLSMTVRAGSMTRADGSIPGPDDPAILSLNPVHTDEIPMPMPDGATPPFAWTLQPAGATFDPPIEIAYPNMAGLPAGAISYFLSFDHDTERFEIVGTGSVDSEGLIIRTDPGSGLSLAGWGGNCPPYSAPSTVRKCGPPDDPPAARAIPSTPSAADFSFIDAPIKPGPLGSSRCGLTVVNIRSAEKIWCECDDSGFERLGRFTLHLEVTSKTYNEDITNPTDIAFVTTHEDTHAEIHRAFVGAVEELSKVFNRVHFDSSADCIVAKWEFYDTYIEQLKIFNAVQDSIDTDAAAEECGRILARASPSPRLAAAGSPSDAYHGFRYSDSLTGLFRDEWTVRVNGQTALIDSSQSFRIPNVTAPDRFGADGPGSPPDFESDGSLWVWGQNNQGQLGDDTTSRRTAPIQVGDQPEWAHAAAGGAHTVGIKTDGSLWTWGDNRYGQLGDGFNDDRDAPTRVGLDLDWRLVAAGDYHTLAIKTDGSLWAWGRNFDRQLGDGTRQDSILPVRIGTDNDWSLVAGGGAHSLGVRTDGSLWAWGENGRGRLGDGTQVDRAEPTPIDSTGTWARIVAGEQHSMGLKSDKTLWAWGTNFRGQLGVGGRVRVDSDSQWGYPPDESSE